MPTEPSLDDLRRHAVARTLFTPTTLPAAIQRLGFVQADPIRAPARAQDLTLRHRVKDYRAGDLERRYARLAIDEDCLVNYGFLPSGHLALMHPRQARKAWDAETQRKAAEVLAFVRERGAVHPREVEQHFSHGSVKNYWGGSGSASTQLLDGMHYRGLLRVKRRDSGTRVYEAIAHPPADDSPAASARRAAALIDLVVRKYAPLPAPSLTYLVRLLGYGAPHLAQQTQAALRL
ncbi:DNA glycosylase AlkZ-like family protein, partial [Delftia tsuruhatensis]